jgi:putative phosphoribosyl transferase
MRFANREDAGRRLAAELLRFQSQHPVVLALPRGGVPVGFEVAARLEAPLDVVLVRKIGHPEMPELAIGAVAEGVEMEKVINDDIIAEFDVTRAYLDEEVARQQHEIERRRRLYLKDLPRVDIFQHTAIVVDDGIATGATMRAALRATRKRSPARLVLAVPVAPARTLAAFRSEADEIVCLAAPEEFGAVGAFYVDFRPVEDATVVELLDRAARRRMAACDATGASVRDPPVTASSPHPTQSR